MQLRVVNTRRVSSTHGLEVLRLQVSGNCSKLRPTGLLSVWPLAWVSTCRRMVSGWGWGKPEAFHPSPGLVPWLRVKEPGPSLWSVTTWSSLGQRFPHLQRDEQRQLMNSLPHGPRGNLYTAWKAVAPHDNCQEKVEIKTLTQFCLWVTHSGQ